jgi:hypothetical protein
MRHKESNAILAAAEARKAARRAKRERNRKGNTDSTVPIPEPVVVVDAEVVSAAEDHQAKPSEIEELLLHHARDASKLARDVAHFEATWVEFVSTADAELVPGTLAMVAKIDRLRAGLVNETMRVAEIVHDLPRTRMNLTIRDSAVLVAPSRRENGQTE